MLPWGTPIKKGPDLKDFLYESSPGRWESVQRKTGLRLRDVMDRYEELTHKKESPDRWLLNDFGPIAIRYYIDKNNNRKQDKDEALSGEMLHTAPDNELDSSAPLGLSHGCIHIHPLDRQRLMDNQAFKIGTLLIVHRYDEACLVPRRSRGPT